MSQFAVIYVLFKIKLTKITAHAMRGGNFDVTISGFPQLQTFSANRDIVQKFMFEVAEN